MKKLILSLVAMFGMSMGASAYSTSAVFLQHKGNVTTFEPDSIQKAFDASVDGDTILLNEGTFPGFEFNKRITVRGMGKTSVVNGSIIVSIPADTTRLTSNLIESISVNDIKITTAINGAKIYKCLMNTIEFHAVDNMIIDRCQISGKTFYQYQYYIYGLILPYNGGRLTVINSKINDIVCDESSHWGNGKRTTLVNCNINNITSPHTIGTVGFMGTIINSIIDSSSKPLGRGCTLTNNLINTKVKIDDTCITNNNNMYEFNGDFVSDTENECVLDTETLIGNGYFGNDGTVVGIYGGTTPFTLEPAVPKVTNSLMQLDTENKKLNVTLTVSPQ